MAYLSDATNDDFHKPDKDSPEAREVSFIYALQSAHGTPTAADLVARAKLIHGYIFENTSPTVEARRNLTGTSLPSAPSRS